MMLDFIDEKKYCQLNRTDVFMKHLVLICDFSK